MGCSTAPTRTCTVLPFTSYTGTCFSRAAYQGTDEGIVCNLYVEPVSQTVFCVMTNGCKTTREDGIMRITRRLCAAAAEVFLPEAD